jgi:hypothetical protein
MTYANRVGEDIAGTADFIPGVGDALGVAETKEAYDKGNWWDMGINAAATGAGLVPGVGDVAGKGIKAAGRGIERLLGREAGDVGREAGDVGREALAKTVRPGTIGQIDNPAALNAAGVSPHDFQSTEDWHRFGLEHGVPNLGSPNEADWQASLQSYPTSAGDRMFTVPGGADSREPFTYFDLLHLKSQGINPNEIPPELHQKIHDRMLTTMSPEGEVSPERIMNQLSLGQISPNQPLSPNALAVARIMVKEGTDDLEKLGGMVPWHHSDDPATSGARDVVSSRQAIDKKTKEPKFLKSGEPKMIDTTRRDELSSQIANNLGLGAGEQGGLGARGTADYTRIAESAQRVKEDPDFFRFRGAGEGASPDTHDAGNWANFVERLMNQTPGLSSKTGSFSGVWQNPKQANISAVDRHMAGKFTAEMFPTPEDFEGFKNTTVEKYRRANPDAGPISFEALPQAAKNDAMFGYLNNSNSAKYRTKAPAVKVGSGPGAGIGDNGGPPMNDAVVNSLVPDHLKPENARWVHEPESFTPISEPYKRVLDANAEEANKAGQSIFGSQWMLWDRIRNRLEPHEMMFPGLEKLPRMSMEQMHVANRELKDAGYMSSSKDIDAWTGEKRLTPVRPMSHPSRASYFTAPAATIGGGALTYEALKDRENDNKKNKKKSREES